MSLVRIFYLEKICKNHRKAVIHNEQRFKAKAVDDRKNKISVSNIAQVLEFPD